MQACLVAVSEAPKRMRRCIATGKVGDRATMIRFVAAPDAAVVPDVAGRLPGRGVWVAAEAEALRVACRRRLFAKSLKSQITVPPDLIEQLERLLSRRCVELISLANRAGEAVFGFEKCQGWVLAGRGALLLAAAGGSPRERTRLLGAVRDLPVVDCLTAAELGQAAGRDHVVHGLIGRGRLAGKLAAEAARLGGVRAAGDAAGGHSDITTLSTGQR